MAEAITESFCERCGTRYEFKAPTRLTPLRKTRGLVSGLRNYIMSQDALGDAIGDAMRTEEDALATAQLEAFHESFNFCISCRQYTCLNCWNDGAGRCRTCAPIAGTDDLLVQLQSAFAGGNGADAAVPQLEYDAAIDEGELQRRLGVGPWPAADLPATNGETPAAWPEAEPIVAEAAPEPETEPELQPEPMPAAAEIEPEPMPAAVEPEPIPAVAEVEPEPMPIPAAPEPALHPLLRVVAWDEDIPAAEEPEPAIAELEPEPAAAELEPEAIPEPEPYAAPEPPPAIRPIAPIAETILRLPRQPATPPPAPLPAPAQPEAEPVAAQLDSEELAARRAQLDLLGLGDVGQGPVTSQPGTVLPYRSRGAAAHPSDAARSAAAAEGVSFWEASAREVADTTSHIGLHSCDGCGLSLSANARFCRRCGTRQARSA